MPAGQQLGFMAVQGVRTFQTFSHAISSLLLHLMKKPNSKEEYRLRNNTQK